MWFIYALLGALFSSFRKVNEKHLSHTVHHLHLAWMTRLVALPVIGLIALLTGELLSSQVLSSMFWVSLVLVVFVTTPLDTIIYLHSLKHGQLSKTAPLHSLTPVLVLVSGTIFLKQIPSTLAVLAVLTIVAGVYVLNTERGSGNVFRNLWGDRGTRFGVISIVTLACNLTLGAIGVLHSSPLFFAFWVTFGSVIVQCMYAQILARGKYRHAHKGMIFQNGAIQGMTAAVSYYAVATGPVAYVTAIRSLSSVFSAIFGARVFNEGMGMRKMVALTLIAVGTVMLGLVAKRF
jgi:uncharacterized membrane protein